MTTLALISDTHAELGGQYVKNLPKDGEVDILIAAGDIDAGTAGLELLIDRYEKTMLLYVAGNHEYFDSSIVEIDKQAEILACGRNNVHYFGKYASYVDYQDLRFVGFTNWSEQTNATDAVSVSKRVEDYSRISDLNVTQMSAAENWLAANVFVDDKQTMVGVTHFLPINECIAPRFEGSGLNSYFVQEPSESNVFDKYDYWLFGHTHDSVVHKNRGCLFISHPKGYPSESGVLYKPLYLRV